ncbi:hypothetical protein AKJ16_DCAP23821 [Drosera capensis]
MVVQSTLSSLHCAELVVKFDGFDSFSNVVAMLGHVRTLMLSKSFLGQLSRGAIQIAKVFSLSGGTYHKPRQQDWSNDRLPEDVHNELQDFMSDNFDNLNSEDGCQTCLRTHLKKITICGYIKNTHDLVPYIAKIFLLSASVLDEFTIMKKAVYDEDELTKGELLTLPMVAPPLNRSHYRASTSLSRTMQAPSSFTMHMALAKGIGDAFVLSRKSNPSTSG